MADEKKKQIGLGALCVVVIALAAFVLKREIPTEGPGLVGARQPPAASPGGGQGGGGQRQGGGQRPPGTGGQITSVTAQAITVQPRTGAAKTFALTASTKITVDQKPAKAADLKAGLRGFVVSKDSKTADEVHLRTGAGPGGPGGGPGGPGGPPPPGAPG